MRLVLFLVFCLHLTSAYASSVRTLIQESIMARLAEMELKIHQQETELVETKAAMKKQESELVQLKESSRSFQSEVFMTIQNRLDQLNASMLQQEEKIMTRIDQFPCNQFSTTPTPMTTTTTPSTAVSPYTNLLDLRNDPCMPPLKNQGQCEFGDWAFAIVTPLEFSYCKKHNGNLTLFSEQQLLDCVTGEYNRNNGCNRDIPWNSGLYLSNYAVLGSITWVSSSASYPLTSDKTGSAGTCKQGDETGIKITNWNLDIVSATSAIKRTVPAIIDAMNQYGPLTSMMSVTSDIFNSYTGGIYSDPNCGTGSSVGRTLAIVGYGHDSSSATDYWIVRGSFGTEWGDRGYMHVKRGVDYCNIESFPIYATAH